MSDDAFRFVRDEDEDAQHMDDWRVRDQIRYYAQLYREYVIIDLSHTDRVGMRWRLEREVLEGKGETICCAKGCPAHLGLQSFEVPFCYQEGGARKVELVKARVCPGCSTKLRASAQGGSGSGNATGAAEAPARKRSRKAAPAVA